MRRVICLCLMMMAAPMHGYARAESHREEQNIVNFLKGLEQYWNERQINRFVQGYWKSDHTLYAGCSHVFHGWKAVRQHVVNSYDDKATLILSNIKPIETTSLIPGIAFVSLHWELKGSSSSSGESIVVLRKVRGEWKIANDSSFSTRGC